MRYEEIVKSFDTDEEITLLLGKLAKNYFDEIDNINGQLINQIGKKAGDPVITECYMICRYKSELHLVARRNAIY